MKRIILAVLAIVFVCTVSPGFQNAASATEKGAAEKAPIYSAFEKSYNNYVANPSEDAARIMIAEYKKLEKQEGGKEALFAKVKTILPTCEQCETQKQNCMFWCIRTQSPDCEAFCSAQYLGCIIGCISS